MTPLLQAIALGAARAGAMFAGGWLAQHGLATADQATSFEGSVIFLAGLGFSIADKLIVHGKIADAAK